MEHTDYAGIATLIAAIAAAIVSVLTAIQSLRNAKKMDEVHNAVNGLADRRAEEAFKSGVIAATVAQKRREQDPSVPPERRPSV